jgi:hypothetical protein
MAFGLEMGFLAGGIIGAAVLAWQWYVNRNPSVTSTTGGSLVDRGFDATLALGISMILLPWRLLAVFNNPACQAAIKTLYDAVWAAVWESRTAATETTAEPTAIEKVTAELADLKARVVPVATSGPVVTDAGVKVVEAAS